jgi:hypothetical protein
MMTPTAITVRLKPSLDKLGTPRATSRGADTTGVTTGVTAAVPALPARPAHLALVVATSSAPSKSAGQMVANDHPYPNIRNAKFSGSPT